ncbi:MAG: NAD-dependent epimerase/dehydratase family protein [Candidatus Eremiobacteraeota bacterium]|nr:NAD-dependent epimerase/dehydratase family protein [Candidatus Eremiobacteraeota bacterium]
MTASPKTVFITGADGFVGSSLVRAFSEDGWCVIKGSRRPIEGADSVTRAYDLAWQALPPGLLDDVDAVVHAAMTRGAHDAEAIEANVEAARLLKAAADARGSHFIFVSSLAARDDAPSAYGKQKRRVELLLADSDAAIVRPGLVVGAGGLFLKMAAHLKRSPFVPIFNGGRQPLQTVHVDDVTRAIVRIANARIAGTFVLAESPPVPYRTFLESLAQSLSRRAVLVPVPFGLFRSAAAVAARIGVTLPADADSVLGLLALRDTPPTADARVVDRPLRSYRESLASLAEQLTLD